MVVGALVIHIAAKAATASQAIARGSEEAVDLTPEATEPAPVPAMARSSEEVDLTPEATESAPVPAMTGATRLSRRGFVATLFATAGVLVLTVAGETVAPLQRLAALAPRNPSVGRRTCPSTSQR